jgi:hypothetical protein
MVRKRERSDAMTSRPIKATAATILALAVVASALAVSPAAGSSFDSGHYSYGHSNCSGYDHVDPVTIVFYGYTAFYLQSRHIVQMYTGWSGDDSTGQYGLSHGVCTHMDGESYTNCPWYLPLCDRYHIRYNQTHTLDAYGRYETVGTPHYDKVKLCYVRYVGWVPKHVARDYTGVRNYIHTKLSGYKSYWQWWGNTQPQKQCDGSYVSSDGYVLWQRVEN